jgi:2-polyprenyl-3-methyl-5-hydroxy-6-metoxy-1,4-benzoquinol methylase
MASKIGNVELILDHHGGNEEYSDGDIENDILDHMVRRTDSSEVISKDPRWPIIYHLWPKRENLLDWYDFRPDASLLEVGAGCGALTGLFCRKVKDVVAVEISARRAKIIATRHQQEQNLQVYAGRLQDIPLQKKFDYVTLIGVLEYAGIYHHSNDPYDDFLYSMRKLLKDDGTLILAIENKLGLKYWAGAPEDHTGKMFEGLEGYVENKGLRTFGRIELQGMLEKAGFSQCDFYYPLPDYKLPDIIFSDHYLPKLGDVTGQSPNYDQPRFDLFREELVMNGLLANQAFETMANSFLVFCRR